MNIRDPNSPTWEVSSTELARHFSEYLARVRFGGKRIVVHKNRKPVAQLSALPSERCTLGEFLEAWGDEHDAAFAADLERVNRTDTPGANPWA
jgi:prevent-host-death family protein